MTTKITKSKLAALISNMVKAEVTESIKAQSAFETNDFISVIKDPEFKKDATYEKFLKQIREDHYNIVIEKYSGGTFYINVFNGMGKVICTYELSSNFKQLEHVRTSDNKYILVTSDHLFKKLSD